jgi:hypothetical protein
MDGRPSLTKTQAKLNITKDGKTCMTQAKLNITKDFLKSLRSLEEFRKNPHVKIPPKSPSINFQSLGKFKNPIFTSEILFLDFGPADLAAHPASQPSQPTGRAAPVGRNRPGRPILPARRSRVRGKYVFPFGSRLPSRPPLPRLSVNQALDVSSIPHL